MTAARRAKERPVSIYAKSVAEALRRNLSRSPTAVMVFSPYLTSGTAERVVGACCAETSEVYTVFTTEQFATGASSIRTVIKLLEQGYQVFHIPDLHAKVTLTSDFASVGSQNLTARGTKNREVTALITDAGAIADLRDGLAPWLELRQPVTLEMACDMEQRIGPLAKEWRKLKAQIDEADQAIVEAEEERRRQAEEESRTSAERARQLQDFQDAIDACPTAPEVIRVRLDTKHYGYGWDSGSYRTLSVSNPRANLLEWTLNGETVSLEKRLRYLVVDVTTGRLGWVAFNKRQLSQFADGVNMDWSFSGRDLRLGLEAPEPSNDAPVNLVAKVHPSGHSGAITIRAFLGLGGLDIRQIDVDANDWGGETIAAKMRERPALLKVALLDAVITPFRFQKNKTGSSPASFLKRGGAFFLKVREFRGHPFCSIEPVGHRAHEDQ